MNCAYDIRILCPYAAAASIALLACSCPLMSAISVPYSGSSIASGLDETTSVYHKRKMSAKCLGLCFLTKGAIRSTMSGREMIIVIDMGHRKGRYREQSKGL